MLSWNHDNKYINGFSSSPKVEDEPYFLTDAYFRCLRLFKYYSKASLL